MIWLFSDSYAAEYQCESGLDEEDTDQNAERYRHEHRLEERVDTEQNGEDTEDQLKYPDTGAGSLGYWEGGDDVDDTHQHEPDSCHNEHYILREKEWLGEYQHHDAQDNAQYTENEADPEFFSRNTSDNTDDTESNYHNNDKIAGLHKCEQRSEHTGKTSRDHQDAQNDE